MPINNSIYRGIKRKLSLAGVALLIASFSFGLSARVALAQQAGGTLVYIVQPEPPSLAPYLSTSGPIGLVAPKIYQGLLDYDLDLNIVPELAESYEVSEDGLTVTFNLQKGVTWHDGKPFTSADVQFTIMEVLKKFHPRGPLGNNPVGTGPFKFVDWKKGQYIRLEKNENYWKEGLPYLDRVVARIIPDASTRTAAMESGEVMYGAFGAIPNVDVVRLREMDSIGVTTEGYSMINPMSLIEFDTTKPPFDNAAIRNAISMTIDRQFLIDNIWFGYGNAATSALSSNFEPTGLYKASDNYPGKPDVAAANKMLDDAGITADGDGVRVKATLDLIPYGEDWRRAGEYIKQSLAEIGIQLDLRYEDVPTWIKRVYGDYDFAMNLNYFYQLPDPVIGVHRHYGTDQIRKGTPFVNSTRYSDEELDALLVAGATSADPEERKGIYAKIQDKLSADQPVVNLFEMQFITVFNNKLKDHDFSAMGSYSSFDRTWLEQ